MVEQYYNFYKNLLTKEISRSLRPDEVAGDICSNPRKVVLHLQHQILDFEVTREKKV